MVDVEIEVEMTAVRARERVHRLPFTVVIDSCGVAIQATAQRRETPARAQDEGRKERTPRAAGALCILNWEIEVSCDLMLNNGLTETKVSGRSKRDRMAMDRWYIVMRLHRPETRAASGAA